MVTQYCPKLYPAPRAITANSYYYPLQTVDAVGAWAASVARQLPEYVELTMFRESAPPDIHECVACLNDLESFWGANPRFTEPPA